MIDPDEKNGEELPEKPEEGQDQEQAPNARTQAAAAATLQSLGERLVRLTDKDLARVPLDEGLRDAVIEARRLAPRTEAMRRQLQFIGKIMRRGDIDTQAIARAVDDVTTGADAARLQRAAERWRDRLLSEGDAALQELVRQYAAANRQHLRQLLRACRKEEPDTPARNERQRELTAALRALLS